MACTEFFPKIRQLCLLEVSLGSLLPRGDLIGTGKGQSPVTINGQYSVEFLGLGATLHHSKILHTSEVIAFHIVHSLPLQD